MNENLQDIYNQYDLLLPPKDDGIIIFWLDHKIRKKEIDSNFTYQDIQQAIKETMIVEDERIPRTERVLKNLLHYFIERPADKKNRYKLSDYALKFILLINHKLNNPFRKFPLRESFKKYTEFKAEDIYTIELFESWYEQGFNYTTRQNILDHLEALKDDVNNSIHSLSKILHIDDHSISEIVKQFSEIFKNLGAKAEEIKDTLRLGNNLEQEIQKVVSAFYKKIVETKHPENEAEMAEYSIIEGSYNRAVNIQNEVKSFFLVIDGKLGQLREKIVFASGKLNELQDNFRYQTKFKVNLKRMLELILQESKYGKEGPGLPINFPRKAIPFEDTKYLIVPYYDFNHSIVQNVQPMELDIEYEREQKQLIEQELLRQENTAKWIEKFKHMLLEQGELDFTKYFYEILEIENDIEIALQVGFELFQYASTLTDFTININRQLVDTHKQNNILTWKMNIYSRKKAHLLS